MKPTETKFSVWRSAADIGPEIEIITLISQL